MNWTGSSSGSPTDKTYKESNQMKKWADVVKTFHTPVCGAAHFLLLISARRRVSVPVVVEAVEGIVRVVKHVCCVTRQMCSLQPSSSSSSALSCSSPLLHAPDTKSKASADDAATPLTPPSLSQLQVSQLLELVPRYVFHNPHINHILSPSL